MKTKSLLILLFMIALTNTGKPQGVKGFGLKTGISVANHKWNYSESYLDKVYKYSPSSVVFFNIGVFGEFLNTEYVSTVIDFWYTSKGADFKYDSKDMYGNKIGTEKVENRLRYFSFSLTEKFRLESRRQGFGIYLAAGPRVDLLLSRSYDIDFTGVYEHSSATTFGLALAGGFSFMLTGSRVLFELFCNPDFSKTVDNSHGYVKNYDYGIRVGFEGILKKK